MTKAFGAAALAVATLVSVVMAPTPAQATEVVTLTPVQWGYIDADRPEQSFADPVEPPTAGLTYDTAGARHVTRSYFTYDLSALMGARVQSASLRLRVTASGDCRARPVELWHTEAFGPASTWRNPPAQRSRLAVVRPAACPAADVEIDVAGVAGQSRVTLGVRVPDGYEFDRRYGKRFAPAPQFTATIERGGGTTPGLPEALRISSGPYDGFRFCSPGTSPLATTTGPTFAASPPTSPVDLRVRATFEIARPGEPAFLTATRPVENGRLFVYQAPLDILADGSYRWRLRAEDGQAMSAWTAWCDFHVSLPQP